MSRHALPVKVTGESTDEAIDRLIAVVTDPDPDASRGTRVKAQARLRELSGHGNREPRRTT